MKTFNWKERLKAFLLIGGIEVASSFLLPFAPRNDLYYAFCAAFNALTMIALIGYFEFTVFSFDLFKLTVVQVFFQLMGWVIYQTRLPVEIYNYSIHIIVLLTFLRILLVGANDGYYTSPANRCLSALGFSLGRKQNKGTVS